MHMIHTVYTPFLKCPKLTLVCASNNPLNKSIDVSHVTLKAYRYNDTVKLIKNPIKVINKAPAMPCCNLHTCLEPAF